MHYFSLAAFKIFPLSFIFWNIIMMCLGVDFFGFILFRVAELFQSAGLYLSPHLGSFQPLFLWVVFHTHFPSLFFSWECDEMNVGFFCCSLTGYWGSIHFFFSLYSLYCSDYMNCISQSRNSLILILCHLCSVSCFFVILPFIYIISIWFFFK